MSIKEPTTTPNSVLEEDEPGIWTPDTPPQFPVPHPEDNSGREYDPWDILYREKRLELEGKCNSWRDEIQSLLTFTGLFSAVVAGFLASTYKDLSIDPTETTNMLLAQVATRLDASIGINSSSVPPLSLDPPFAPPPSVVRVHAFWFLSLALSLSTAVIAILCLQWIREVQQPPSAVDGRKGFIIVFMRMESFYRWQVPGIITYLPLSLQISLVLFFVGIIDFLLPFNKAISIPTITVIAATFIFLLYTSIAQTAQFVISDFRQRGPPRYPCAYRSPQALLTSAVCIFFLVFPILISFSLSLFLFFFSLLIVAFAFNLVALPLVLVFVMVLKMLISGPRPAISGLVDLFQKIATPSNWGSTRRARQRMDSYKRLRQGFGLTIQYSHEWFSSDQGWLDNYDPTQTKGNPGGQGRSFHQEWHYTTEGLATITSPNPHANRAIYQGIQTSPISFTTADSCPEPKSYYSTNALVVLDPGIANATDRRLLSSWRDPPSALRHAEYQALLIQTLPVTYMSSHAGSLAWYQVELYIRVLAGIYAGPSWMECLPDRPGIGPSVMLPKIFALAGSARMMLRTPAGHKCIEQVGLILASFVKHVVGSNPPVSVGQYHRLNDIMQLNLLSATWFFEVTAGISPEGEVLTPAILRCFSSFTRIHRLLSCFLESALGRLQGPGAKSPDWAPFPIAWATAYQYVVVSLVDMPRTLEQDTVVSRAHWDALPHIRFLDAQEQEAVQGYISSFKTLFQLVDKILHVVDPPDFATSWSDPTLPEGSDNGWPGFTAEDRFGFLEKLGLKRESLETRTDPSTSTALKPDPADASVELESTAKASPAETKVASDRVDTVEMVIPETRGPEDIGAPTNTGGIRSSDVSVIQASRAGYPSPLTTPPSADHVAVDIPPAFPFPPSSSTYPSHGQPLTSAAMDTKGQPDPAGQIGGEAMDDDEKSMRGANLTREIQGDSQVNSGQGAGVSTTSTVMAGAGVEGPLVLIPPDVEVRFKDPPSGEDGFLRPV